MVTNISETKEWKKIIIDCLNRLNAHDVIKYDINGLTGSLIVEINFNQGGITDLDVSIKRKFK